MTAWLKDDYFDCLPINDFYEEVNPYVIHREQLHCFSHPH